MRLSCAQIQLPECIYTGIAGVVGTDARGFFYAPGHTLKKQNIQYTIALVRFTME